MQLESSDWPLFGWIDDVRPALAEARAAGRAVVLGTLVAVEGSSPRPAGSQMLFDGNRGQGYFSGGCLEADVANHAADVLASGAPRVLVYGHGSPWIDIRLLCGGRLEILLERIEADDEAAGMLLDLWRARSPAYWQSDGMTRSVTRRLPAIAEGSVTRRFDPTWQLVVVGGDPIALALASLGAQSGFATTLLRPGGPTGDPPLAGIHYRNGSLKVEMQDIAADRWTAIVSATHDDDIDDEAILAGLNSKAAYVGVLGSARRVPERRRRLTEAGLSPLEIARLHAPIGAAQCGKAPWEVAVSVVAEIMEARTMIMQGEACALAPSSAAAQRTS